MIIDNQKQLLFLACAEQVQTKIDSIKERLILLEESRNNETKSTAGDKYETGRAMMQIEIDNCRTQLLKVEAEQDVLNYIGLKKAAMQVQEGSLVETNRGIYFITIGLGKVKVLGQTYFCISKEAPIAKVLFGKKVGESITFNGNEILIKNIK